ncbi:alpha/beta fold hydrolase [Kordia jejudonensis]|uniref:alpha/beta fold hydrolase n=1 Tax=Kordia jejudonensis TaxID=1348245 RepID=UPI00062938B8|nr:alpha/beta hydrolase [Kordia jejudonensis]
MISVKNFFKNDTYILIQYLLQKFNKKKIVLVAHSYGTLLGFHIAKNHPELIHAFIATNPLVHQSESELLTLEMLKKHAKEQKNTKAINELSKVSIPFKTAEELYYARKWLFDFEGKKYAKKKSFKKRVLSWANTWLPLFNEASQENLFQSLKKIDCPVFFIIGERDYQTNSKLTQSYYNLLQATQKELFTLEKAGHLIPYEHREEFQKIIIENTMPIITTEKN